MNFRTFAGAALTAAALAAVPSIAHAEEFTGPRINAEIGVLDDNFLGSAETSFGFNAGYDVPFNNGGSIVGVTAGYTDTFNDKVSSRELSIGARFGQKVSDKALIYGTASYSNLRLVGFGFDGAKFGAGLEFAVSNGAFVNVETRYGNYEAGAELYQTVAGVGFRF